MRKSKYTLDQIDELLDAVANGGYVPGGSTPDASDFNFADWGNGSFTVKLSDGTTADGSVVFDSEKRPTAIALNGKTVTVTFPTENPA